MTFAPEPRKLKPGEKPQRIEVGEFTTFKLPPIQPPEPSAVDQLAAVVSKRARKRLERKKRWAPLTNEQMAGVLPMTRGATFPMNVTYRRQSR